MTQRLNAYALSPEAFRLMMELEKYIANSDLERSLIHLIKLRASQLNGCAFCIDMHTQEASKDGEVPIRLLLLDAWRESSAYTPEERAALAWTEALTFVAQTRVPDNVYDNLKEHFSPQNIVDLTFAITNINAWNRIAIGFRNEHPPIT